MWYFSWILGVGVALACGIINGLALEMREDGAEDESRAFGASDLL